jgi:hypothetical protein
LPSPVIFARTDAGRAEAGYASERNDCAVRAVAGVGIPYARAHAFWRRVGRKYRTGVRYEISLRKLRFWLRENGIKTQLVRVKGTVEAFVKRNADGTYICTTKTHAFTVAQGVVLDTVKWSGKKRITSAMLCTKL